MTDPHPLVTVKWLAERSEARGIKVIDASWRMPGVGQAREDFNNRHIPGAQFFDIDEIADTSTTLPHMLPSPEVFASAIGAMGVSNEDHVITYDDAGIFSAARLWWTFRAFGHRNISVLDGGLKQWMHKGLPVIDSLPERPPQIFEARLNREIVANSAELRRSITDNNIVVVDARPADRFEGKAPEPRAGLRCGHIPGSINLPFSRLLKETGQMKSVVEMSDEFKNTGVDLSKRIITSCGSGVTASVLALGLEVIGHHDWAVYDGSWSEWGDQKNNANIFPTATGANNG